MPPYVSLLHDVKRRYIGLAKPEDLPAQKNVILVGLTSVYRSILNIKNILKFMNFI